MASIENIKTSKNGFELDCELKQFPVSFVNALRRTTLSTIPTVVVRDVKIYENTTQLPHEMIKHRMEMLPINVGPSDSATIKDTKITLHVIADDDRLVTTDDFAVQSSHPSVIMKDRDFGTPLLFLRMRKGETVRIEARLSVENAQVSQVCVATTGWHIDPERVESSRKKLIESGEDVRVFDNFLIQREFSRNKDGRPNWFDFRIKSVGVLKSKEILSLAINILRSQLDEYVKEAVSNIQKENDPGTYSIILEQGGHTIGYLFQEVLYGDANVNFVSYDVPHPLKKTMVLRFNTSKNAENVLKLAHKTIEEYCSVVEKGL